MRIGVVVDSACDLPREWLDAHRVVVLPITIRSDGNSIADVRDPVATREFYRNHLGDKGHAAETVPYSVEQVRELFLSRLVLDYDFVFCLTIASTRSPIFEHATKASFGILNDYKPVRAKAGVPGPFALRVIDTQNLFPGQAPLAVECVRMVEAGANSTKIRERLEQLVPNTYGYMVPRDLYYLRSRAQKKGDHSVGWFSATLGSALDIKPVIRAHRNDTTPVAKVRHFEQGAEKLFRFTEDRVKRGLLTPVLCISYGGELADLEKLPGYGDLVRTCHMSKVEVLTSVMSLTGVVNVGDGALALGFCAEPHEVKL